MEIVGYEVVETRIPESLDSGSVKTEEKFFREWLKKKKQKKITEEFLCECMQEAFPLGAKVFVSKYYYIFGYDNFGVWAVPVDKEPSSGNKIFITYTMLIRNIDMQTDGLSELDMIKYRLSKPDICKNMIPTKGSLEFYKDYLGKSYSSLWIKENHDRIVLMIVLNLIIKVLLLSAAKLPIPLFLLSIVLDIGAIYL